MKQTLIVIMLMTLIARSYGQPMYDMTPRRHAKDIPFLHNTETNFVDKWLSLSDQTVEDRKFLHDLVEFCKDVGDTAHKYNNGTRVVRIKGILYFIPPNPDSVGYYYYYDARDVEGPLHVAYRTQAIVPGIEYNDIPFAGSIITQRPIEVLRSLMPKRKREKHR